MACEGSPGERRFRLLPVTKGSNRPVMDPEKLGWNWQSDQDYLFEITQEINAFSTTEATVESEGFQDQGKPTAAH